MVWVVLFGVALHYGLAIGRIYYRYAEFEEAMRSSARFASMQSDEAIRRTLVTTVDELGLPDEARQLWIRRSGPPYLIEIEAWYDERLTFPFGKFVDLTFHPKVEFRF